MNSQGWIKVDSFLNLLSSGADLEKVRFSMKYCNLTIVYQDIENDLEVGGGGSHALYRMGKLPDAGADMD
jgi:hypothetical protein